MAKHQMDILGSIAGVSPKQDNLEIANTEHAKSFITASEDFFETNKDLDPKTFKDLWDKKIGDSWDIQPDNKDYYYETLEKIDPQGPQAARNKILTKTTAEIASLDTAQEREWKMKDLASTLPNYAWTELDFFENLNSEKSRLDGQYEETFRIGQFLTYLHGLIEKDFVGLDPDKTSSAHTEDYLKGIRGGHGDDIKVHNGNFSISLNGAVVPLGNLPNNTTDDIRQLLIENRDIKPLVKEKVTKEHERSQQIALKEKKETQKYIFENVGQLPREFQMNAIRDYTMTQRNSGELTYKAITQLVTEKKSTSALDSIRDFKSYFLDILSRTERLMNNG